MKLVSKISISALFILGLAVSFVGCQKENNLSVEPIATKTTFIDYNKTYNVEKGATIIKYGNVYVMDQFGNYNLHRTIKIRNLTWTFVQEWFLDDLNTDMYYPGIDPSILPLPKYYSWKGEMQSAVDGGDFSYIIASDQSGTPALGFHMPKVSNVFAESDIDQLGTALGSNASIRTKLQLTYGGARFWNPSLSPSQACLWIECRNTNYAPNIVANCGVAGVWNLPNDNFGLAFTNIPQTQVNVRLVRNITQAQW